MLFSILWFGSFLSKGRGPIDFQHESARSNYYRRARQALIAGGYHKAKTYAVEALMLHTHCRYHMQDNTDDIDAWILIGVSIRIAMKVGYHRDPSHVADITPFEGEMRRRTFFMLQTFDLLLSFKAGLPTMIHDDEYDTKPPRNLLDDDFDEHCQELPPSRPVTDRTPMLYFCYKSQFTTFLKRTMKLALSLKSCSYEDIMTLDAELREAYKSVPPGLQMRTFGTLISETPRMIVHRLHIDLLYLRSLCVLHRRYLSQERSNPKYDYSRLTSATSAFKILQYQIELHEISKPGHRFENEHWILSSITENDLLSAAMVLSLDLYESYTRPLSPDRADTLATVQEKYDTLQTSHHILSQQNSSRESRRAATVLAAMLTRLPRPQAASSLSPVSNGNGTQLRSPSVSSSWATSSRPPGPSTSNHYAAPPSGSSSMLNTGQISNHPVQSDIYSSDTIFNPLGSPLPSNINTDSMDLNEEDPLAFLFPTDSTATNSLFAFPSSSNIEEDDESNHFVDWVRQPSILDSRPCPALPCLSLRLSIPPYLMFFHFLSSLRCSIYVSAAPPSSLLHREPVDCLFHRLQHGEHVDIEYGRYT